MDDTPAGPVGSRHVEFDACFNFRDLGGYPAAGGARVRWGALYRSDTLHRLTLDDMDRFRALGLRTVIDLRSATEIADFGRFDADGHDLAWRHLAMLDNVRLAPGEPEGAPVVVEAVAPGEGYVRIVEQFGASVADVFRLLASDGALPAVFHCTSGKDRTGIVAALALDLLGVPDDVIADDYVLTAAARARSGPWIERNEPEFAAFLASIPPERRAISGDTILGFLAGVRARHGDAAGLLVHLGVPRRDLERLRDRLVEG